MRTRSAAANSTDEAKDATEGQDLPTSSYEVVRQVETPVGSSHPVSIAERFGISPEDVEAILQMHIPAIQDTPTPVPSVVRVPSLSKTNEILQTNTFDLKSLIKDRFTSASKDNKERYHRLDRVLLNNGLYSMAMKTRPCPTITLLNPTGQTSEQISVASDVVTITPADNVYVWANDLRRLTHCMETICDKTVFHLCKPGFDDHNGILIYTTLKEYYFGKNDQGAKGTRLAMEAWRIKPSSNTLRQDLVLFEELRTQIEYSGELSLNDKWNNSYLDEKFEKDPRTGVEASLTASTQSKWTYKERIAALHALQICDILPHKEVQIKSLAPVKAEPNSKVCFNFNKGACTYGDRCRFTHDKSISSDTKVPYLKSNTVAQHNGRPVKQNQPNYINDRHRSAIGDPRGTKTSSNNLGLSRNQHIGLKAIQSYDPWIDGSHYHNDPHQSIHQVSYKMMTTGPTSSSSSATSTSIQPVQEDDEDDEDGDSDSGASCITDTNLAADIINAHDKDISTYTPAVERTIKRNIYLYKESSTEARASYAGAITMGSYVYFTFFQYPGPHSKHVPDKSDLQIFGWTPSHPLGKYSTPLEMRNGAANFLELISNLGESFLHARFHPVHMQSKVTQESYMTFNPCGYTYHGPGTEGSYISTVSSIESYAYYFNHTKDMDDEIKMYLHLSVLYDFMAFSAQYLRRALKQRTPSTRQLHAPRLLLEVSITQLNNIQERNSVDDTTAEWKYFIRALRAIAESIMPIPLHTEVISTPISTKRPRLASPLLRIKDIGESTLKRPRPTLGLNADLILPILPVPVPLPSIMVDLQTPTKITIQDTPKLSRARGESSSEDSALNYFASVPMNTVAPTTTRFIMDSGAGKSGTSNLSLLKNVKACSDIQVTGAFGPSTTPSHAGQLGPLNLETLHIPSMGVQTLISLSQFCAGGTTGVKYIGVFTPTEYRMYDMLSALPILSDLARHGKEAERGSVQNGIYIRESS